VREFTQTVTCHPQGGWGGNCWQTCVAGLLDLEPGVLPAQAICDLYETDLDGTRGAPRQSPNFRNRLQVYLRKHHGRAYVELHAPDETWPLLRVADPGWHMMAGKTVRSASFGGLTHICIARYGRVVWDPHPSRAGLLSDIRWAVLAPYPESWARDEVERGVVQDDCMCPACWKERNPMADVRCRFVIRSMTEGPCDYAGCTKPDCRTTRVTYALPDGSVVPQLEPGDIFWVDDHVGKETTWCWSNCDGRHLYVVCPDGHTWNVDGRASNCTMRDDREHRCWVRHGDPSSGPITVDKNGRTCAAGAGSIDTGAYHGFLRGGVLVPA
jgi:hypothetical protein